jgi:hypothetical protein
MELVAWGWPFLSRHWFLLGPPSRPHATSAVNLSQFWTGALEARRIFSELPLLVEYLRWRLASYPTSKVPDSNRLVERLTALLFCFRRESHVLRESLSV